MMGNHNCFTTVIFETLIQKIKSLRMKLIEIIDAQRIITHPYIMKVIDPARYGVFIFSMYMAPKCRK